MRGSARGDTLVKFYLSLFSINRIIPTCTAVSRKTFDSVVTPMSPDVMESSDRLRERLVSKLPLLIDRYLSWIRTLSLEQGW